MRKQKDRSYRHIVLFKIQDGVSDQMVKEAIAILKELGQGNSNIIEWQIEKSLDTRKGILIIENSLFASEEDFISFRGSDKHKNAGEFMSKIADWMVGDYIENHK